MLCVFEHRGRIKSFLDEEHVILKEILFTDFI
jgi:hypothetical protein